MVLIVRTTELVNTSRNKQTLLILSEFTYSTITTEVWLKDNQTNEPT